MKVKVSKDELHECVRNAVTRIIKEGKNSKWEKENKHEFAKKSQFNKKQKGNKGNQRWTDDDEDMY